MMRMSSKPCTHVVHFNVTEDQPYHYINFRAKIYVMIRTQPLATFSGNSYSSTHKNFLAGCRFERSPFDLLMNERIC
jgi:hypothetical protein